MKLSVRKLGRVAQADIDLRPLTIFVGPNNTNKSWAAYCLYGLARALTWDPQSKNRLLEDHPDLRTRIEAAAVRVKETVQLHEDTATLSFTRAEVAGGLHGPVRLRMDSSQIADVLRLPATNLEGAEATLEMEAAALSAGLADRMTITLLHRARAARVSVEHHARGWLGTVSTSLQLDNGDDLTPWLEEFVRWLIGMVAVLPAERKALSSTYKLLRPEFEQVLARPVVAYAEFLRL